MFIRWLTHECILIYVNPTPSSRLCSSSCVRPSHLLTSNDLLSPPKKRPFYLGFPWTHPVNLCDESSGLGKLKRSAGELKGGWHTFAGNPKTTNTYTKTYICTYAQTCGGKPWTQEQHSEKTNHKWLGIHMCVHTHTHTVTAYETWWRQVFYQQVQLWYHFLPEVHRKLYRPAGSFTVWQDC